MIQATLHQRTLAFNFVAKTSRGAMQSKDSWFIVLHDHRSNERIGIGECAPLKGLSIDDSDQLPFQLEVLVRMINLRKFDLRDIPTHLGEIAPFLCINFPLIDFRKFPSLMFALEMAFIDLTHGGCQQLFDSSFLQGKPIPINGLIWMGDIDFMLEQVDLKIKAGFRCIKMKIGGIDFQKECDVLSFIRKKYYKEDIEIRLDANGSFNAENVLERLEKLHSYKIHSIEQPLLPNDSGWEHLCRESPIPVALDESLIDIKQDRKATLLDQIRPAYIILKPTLHGGLQACLEWIELATQRGIGWWMTSALESNIGLNAIAQFVATYPLTMPQGLGTGQLFFNNFDAPLEVKSGKLYYDPSKTMERPD